MPRHSLVLDRLNPDAVRLSHSFDIYWMTSFRGRGYWDRSESFYLEDDPWFDACDWPDIRQVEQLLTGQEA